MKNLPEPQRWADHRYCFLEVGDINDGQGANIILNAVRKAHDKPIAFWCVCRKRHKKEVPALCFLLPKANHRVYLYLLPNICPSNPVGHASSFNAHSSQAGVISFNSLLIWVPSFSCEFPQRTLCPSTPYPPLFCFPVCPGPVLYGI